jgi:hypothetical protein
MKREKCLENYRHFEPYKNFKTGQTWVSKTTRTTAGYFQWFNYERKYKNKNKWNKEKAKVEVGSDLFIIIM